MAESWDLYITDHLLASGNVDQAAFVGLKNLDIWASTPNFKPSEQELQDIINGFEKADKLMSNGVRLCGQKYIYQSCSPDVMRLKLGNGGVIIAKTNLTLIIATYNKNIQPGSCSNTVETLGTYLRDQDY